VGPWTDGYRKSITAGRGKGSRKDTQCQSSFEEFLIRKIPKDPPEVKRGPENKRIEDQFALGKEGNFEKGGKKNRNGRENVPFLER